MTSKVPIEIEGLSVYSVDYFYDTFLVETDNPSTLITLPLIPAEGLTFRFKRMDSDPARILELTSPELINGVVNYGIDVGQEVNLVSYLNTGVLTWGVISDEENPAGNFLDSFHLFVDSNTGDDATAQPNNPALPWKTITSAKNYYVTNNLRTYVIWVRPGTYNELEQLGINGKYHFEQGTVVSRTDVSPIFNPSDSIEMVVTGWGTFIGNKNGIAGPSPVPLLKFDQLTTLTNNIYFEALELNNRFGPALVAGNSTIFATARPDPSKFIFKIRLQISSRYNTGDTDPSLALNESAVILGFGVGFNKLLQVPKLLNSGGGIALGTYATGYTSVEQFHQWDVNINTIETTQSNAIALYDLGCSTIIHADTIVGYGGPVQVGTTVVADSGLITTKSAARIFISADSARYGMIDAGVTGFGPNPLIYFTSGTFGSQMIEIKYLSNFIANPDALENFLIVNRGSGNRYFRGEKYFNDIGGLYDGSSSVSTFWQIGECQLNNSYTDGIINTGTGTHLFNISRMFYNVSEPTPRYLFRNTAGTLNCDIASIDINSGDLLNNSSQIYLTGDRISVVKSTGSTPVIQSGGSLIWDFEDLSIFDPTALGGWDLSGGDCHITGEKLLILGDPNGIAITNSIDTTLIELNQININHSVFTTTRGCSLKIESADISSFGNEIIYIFGPFPSIEVMNFNLNRATVIGNGFSSIVVVGDNCNLRGSIDWLQSEIDALTFNTGSRADFTLGTVICSTPVFGAIRVRSVESIVIRSDRISTTGIPVYIDVGATLGDLTIGGILESTTGSNPAIYSVDDLPTDFSLLPGTVLTATGLLSVEEGITGVASVIKNLGTVFQNADVDAGITYLNCFWVSTNGVQLCAGPAGASFNHLFVDSIVGNDATALPDDVSKPWKTITSARNYYVANSLHANNYLIWVRAGEYMESGNLAMNGRYYFENGAVIYPQTFGPLFDSRPSAGVEFDVPIELTVTGDGTFTSNAGLTGSGITGIYPLIVFDGSDISNELSIYIFAGLEVTNAYGSCFRLGQQTSAKINSLFTIDIQQQISNIVAKNFLVSFPLDPEYAVVVLSGNRSNNTISTPRIRGNNAIAVGLNQFGNLNEYTWNLKVDTIDSASNAIYMEFGGNLFVDANDIISGTVDGPIGPLRAVININGNGRIVADRILIKSLVGVYPNIIIRNNGNMDFDIGTLDNDASGNIANPSDYLIRVNGGLITAKIQRARTTSAGLLQYDSPSFTSSIRIENMELFDATNNTAILIADGEVVLSIADASYNRATGGTQISLTGGRLDYTGTKIYVIGGGLLNSSNAICRFSVDSIEFVSPSNTVFLISGTTGSSDLSWHQCVADCSIFIDTEIPTTVDFMSTTITGPTNEVIFAGSGSNLQITGTKLDVSTTATEIFQVIDAVIDISTITSSTGILNGRGRFHCNRLDAGATGDNFVITGNSFINLDQYISLGNGFKITTTNPVTIKAGSAVVASNVVVITVGATLGDVSLQGLFESTGAFSPIFSTNDLPINFKLLPGVVLRSNGGTYSIEEGTAGSDSIVINYGTVDQDEVPSAGITYLNPKVVLPGVQQLTYDFTTSATVGTDIAISAPQLSGKKIFTIVGGYKIGSDFFPFYDVGGANTYYVSTYYQDSGSNIRVTNGPLATNALSRAGQLIVFFQ